MKKLVYISKLAHNQVIEFIELLGYTVVKIDNENICSGKHLESIVNERPYEQLISERLTPFSPSSKVAEAIAHHPDIYMCKLGIDSSSIVFHGNASILENKYPKDSIYNACSTDNFFIHKLSISNKDLLDTAVSMGKILINVPQGYTRCNALPISDDAIITSDMGIYNNTKDKLDVLLIDHGHIQLPGYKYGFIGGCAGRVGNYIVFNGDISRHPNFENIVGFIGSYKLKIIYFDKLPLVDIGSIIEEEIK